MVVEDNLKKMACDFWELVKKGKDFIESQEILEYWNR